MHNHRLRNAVAALLLTIFLTLCTQLVIDVAVTFQVRFNTFEDGTQSISWCLPDSLCREEKGD